MTRIEGIAKEMIAARQANDAEWGHEIEDQRMDPDCWVRAIAQCSTAWARGTFPPFQKLTVDTFRAAMIRVGALSMAAVESLDRQREVGGASFYERESLPKLSFWGSTLELSDKFRSTFVYVEAGRREGSKLRPGEVVGIVQQDKDGRAQIGKAVVLAKVTGSREFFQKNHRTAIEKTYGAGIGVLSRDHEPGVVYTMLTLKRIR